MNIKNEIDNTKEIIKYSKEEKKLFIKDLSIEIISSVLYNILALFLTIAISIFATNKTIAIVLVIVYLNRDVILSYIKYIGKRASEEFSLLREISCIEYYDNILQKVRGKIITKENNISKVMSDNNIVEVCRGHYKFYDNFFIKCTRVVADFMIFIFSFWAIFKTIPDNNISIFSIILLIYSVLLIVFMYFRIKIFEKAQKKIYKNIHQSSDYYLDIINLFPLNKKHSQFLINRYMRLQTENSKENIKLNKVKQIFNFSYSFIRAIFITAIVLFGAFSGGIENVNIEKILLAISISTVLDSLMSSILGYISEFEIFIEQYKSSRLNEERFQLIKQVYNKNKGLKYFSGEELKVSNIDFKYETGDFSLSSSREIILKRGELTLLSGNSGTGKSTLINILSGELGENRSYRLNKIAYFNDKSDIGRSTLIEEITFEEDYTLIDYKKLNEILLGLKLNEKLDEETLQKSSREFLSNGMRQRILLARALYNLGDCDLLCIDEPIGSLDEDNAKQVIKFIKEYCNRDKKRFIILCTHQYKLVEEYIDRKYTIICENNHSTII